jgi:DNA repair photolyase
MNERYHWIPQWDKPEPKEIHWTNLKNSINKHEKGRIFLGSASDSYQPLEEELQLTRKLLKDYLIPSKHHILILTKSNLIARDFDIIQGNRNVWVGMTITSLEKNPLEPNSPSPKDRLEALKEAHSLGIKTFISIEPWIPKITNPVNIIDESLRYVDFYIIGSLNYYGNELEKKETYISEIPEVLKILASNKKEFWIKEELLGLIGRNVHWNESLEHKKMWFNPKLIPLVLEGKKTTTIRGRKLCNVGDVLEIASRDYNGPTRLIKVLNIYSKKLGELTDEEIHRDGFSSLEELQEFWRKELKKVWDDNRTVYIHEFQLL